MRKCDICGVKQTEIDGSISYHEDSGQKRCPSCAEEQEGLSQF